MFEDAPNRPRWNHQCVKEATALQFSESIRIWAECHGVADADTCSKQFNAAVALAFIESPDAYAAARYFEDFFDWPVQTSLLLILLRAYDSMKFVTRDFVHQWVMDHSIRFPAKKFDLVRCKIGDLELTGQVVEIVRREARGFIIPTGKNKPIPIFAEEILQVLPKRDNPKDVA